MNINTNSTSFGSVRLSALRRDHNDYSTEGRYPHYLIDIIPDKSDKVTINGNDLGTSVSAKKATNLAEQDNTPKRINKIKNYLLAMLGQNSDLDTTSADPEKCFFIGNNNGQNAKEFFVKNQDNFIKCLKNGTLEHLDSDNSIRFNIRGNLSYYEELPVAKNAWPL